MKRNCNGCRAWYQDTLIEDSEPYCRLEYPTEIKHILYHGVGFAVYMWEMKPTVECPKPRSFSKLFLECDRYKGDLK